MAPSDPTTIKVSKSLRDRISLSAAAQHQTVQKFMEHPRATRTPIAAEALATADNDTLDEWHPESQGVGGRRWRSRCRAVTDPVPTSPTSTRKQRQVYHSLVPQRYKTLVHEGSPLVTISASEARQRLFPLLEQVNTDHEPVRITSKAGDAVLMSANDYDSWQETVYLLRSPENARRLMEAVARDKTSRTAVTKSIDELQEMAGGQE
jgi:antitoxin YefM